MNLLRAIWLFLRIVWRNFDNPAIPKPYRSTYRIEPRIAWDIARKVWAGEGR